jgi:hypothetical protein
MESSRAGLDVLLIELEDTEFVGPPERESKFIGTVRIGSSLTLCIALPQLQRMALEGLPTVEELTIVITTEEARARRSAGRLIFEDSYEQRREFLAGLAELSLGVIAKEEAFLHPQLPPERESRLAPQLTRYGPKGYKSAAQLRRDATKLSGRRRR